jgi:hypothetical protein
VWLYAAGITCRYPAGILSQVFTSYSRVDAEFVAIFIRRLQRAFPELTIWYDRAPHGLIGGGNWWVDILTAIGASDVFMCILSNESVNSLYCQAEFAEAPASEAHPHRAGARQDGAKGECAVARRHGAPLCVLPGLGRDSAGDPRAFACSPADSSQSARPAC